MMKGYCCNSNKGNSQTSLEDLNNEMLLEILCRLPCYQTALGCKTVSKRWYSLISNPLFITQGFLAHRKINKEKKSSVAFLLTMSMWDKTDATAMVAPPCFQKTLWSPILPLQFLPFHSKPVATFKDLVLSFGVNPLTGLGVFYICNPLTKQCMVLPPSQIQEIKVDWTALTYLEGRGFRAVVAYDNSIAFYSDYAFMMVNLSVYISEARQWRDIRVKVQLQPSNNGCSNIGGPFKGVMCKGMLCIHNAKNIGAFNPFDVTNNFHGTLTAINLPLPTGDVGVILLLESDGKLVAFEDTCVNLRADYEGNLAENLSAGKRIWKLEMMSQQIPQWELISQFDSHINLKGSILTSPHCCRYGYNNLQVLGVHPSKEHLMYLIKCDRYPQHRFILYDTKAKTLEALATKIPPHNITPCNKLDIPCWPTPIPFPL